MIASDLDKSSGEITSNSPEALKYFSEGIAFDLKMEYPEAVVQFKNAVAADPKFAMAHHRLSACYSNMGEEAEAQKYRQKAMELRGRVSERERLLIESDYYSYDKNEPEKSIEILLKLLKLYPDDLLGNRYLAIVYGHLGQMDKNILYREKAFRLYPESPKDCLNLVNSYLYMGWLGKIEEFLKAYLKDFPDTLSARWQLFEAYVYQNKFDLALSELDARLRLEPKFQITINRAVVYYSKGDVQATEQECQKLLNSKNKKDQCWGKMITSYLLVLKGLLGKAKNSYEETLAWATKEEDRKELSYLVIYLSWIFQNLIGLDLAMGNFSEANELGEEAIRIFREEKESIYQWLRLRIFFIFQGRIQLAQKNIAEAMKTTEELRNHMANEKDQSLQCLPLFLSGLTDIERGDYQKAIGELEKAEELLGTFSTTLPFWEWQALYHEALGRAYFMGKKLKKAEEEYRKIASTGIYRLMPETWVQSFYWLGRIAEERGKKGRAREHYTKFLDFWKNADPGLPIVEDAKKRLSAL